MTLAPEGSEPTSLRLQWRARQRATDLVTDGHLDLGRDLGSVYHLSVVNRLSNAFQEDFRTLITLLRGQYEDEQPAIGCQGLAYLRFHGIGSGPTSKPDHEGGITDLAQISLDDI